MLELIHGGDIQAASHRFPNAPRPWIDLSTGLNANAYPVDQLPKEAFSQLPYLQEDFLAAAAAFYGSDSFVASAGSQSVIEQLPHLLADLPLLVPEIGYQEYAFCWQKAGRALTYYASLDKFVALKEIEQALDVNAHQHLLIINPNNPTGLFFTIDELLVMRQKMAPEAYLIVDEAFIEFEQSPSMIGQLDQDKIIILRSFGKYFGLAGLRLGFVFSNREFCRQLKNKIGLWAVNGVAQAIAVKALNDKKWQANTQDQCNKDSLYTEQLFSQLFKEHTMQKFHKPLFCSYLMQSDKADAYYHKLAEQGILIRLLAVDAKHKLLRVGNSQYANVLLESRLQQLKNS